VTVIVTKRAAASPPPQGLVPKCLSLPAAPLKVTAFVAKIVGEALTLSSKRHQQYAMSRKNALGTTIAVTFASCRAGFASKSPVLGEATRVKSGPAYPYGKSPQSLSPLPHARAAFSRKSALSSSRAGKNRACAPAIENDHNSYHLCPEAPPSIAFREGSTSNDSPEMAD
jgi:hypothetical protein